jgi:hypothetical protein
MTLISRVWARIRRRTPAEPHIVERTATAIELELRRRYPTGVADHDYDVWAFLLAGASEALDCDPFDPRCAELAGWHVRRMRDEALADANRQPDWLV